MATDEGSGTGKLLFGAGFAFGVMVTLLLLAVVVAVTAGDGSGDRLTVVATAAAGVLFAAIVGGGLYVLAFPENRTRISVDPAQFERDGEE